MNRPGIPLRTRMRLPRFRAKNFSTCTRSPTAQGSSHASHSPWDDDGNLHARAGRHGDRALDGYRGLAHRVLAGGPTLLSGRGSRLVLSASGSTEIRTVPNVGLARSAASGHWDRSPEYHAVSG